MVTTYEDLGKECKDLFEEHYNVGQLKLDLKNKVSSALAFNFNGLCSQENGKVTSTLETKYDFSSYGFQTNIKANTDNDLLTEVMFSDASLLGNGFKIFFNTKMGLVSNKRSGSVKASMDGSGYNVIGELEFEGGSPRLNASGVYQYSDLLLGSQAQIDVKGHKIVKQSMAAGYRQSGMSLIANYENFKELSVGIYKRVSGSEERGVQLNFDEKNQAKLVFGVKYLIDGSSAVKAKVSNTGQIGLAYLYQIRPGFNISISTSLEAKNLMSGGHKLGMGIAFDG